MSKKKTTIITGFVVLMFVLLAGGRYLSAFPTIPKPGGHDAGMVTWDVRLSHPYVERGGDRELLLNMKIRGKDAGARERTPVNLVLVIDRSGSMGDRGKIEYAKEAAKQIIARLGKDDRLGVVAYSTDVEILYPIQFLRDKEVASSVVSSLYPTNSTNLSGGLIAGIGQVESLKRDGYINRVILLSDGLANVGITDIGDLSRVASRASGKGIHVTAMGLGVSYDEDLMMNIAEYGAGNYYFIESPGQLAGIFGKEFGQIAATVAKDPAIRLALAPGVKVDEVYGYTYTKGVDGKVEIKLGDFFGGQERDIMIKLIVPAGTVGMRELAEASLDYDDLLNRSRASVLRTDLTYEVTGDREKVASNEDKDVTARWVSVDSAGDYFQAATAYEEGRQEDALSYIKSAYERVAELNRTPYKNKKTVKQEAELRDALESMSVAAPEPETDAGKKLIKEQKAGARQQQK